VKSSSRRIVDRLAFGVSLTGAAITAVLLVERRGSSVWTQFAVAIATGAVLLGAMISAYLGYTSVRFRRFRDSTLQQASTKNYFPPGSTQDSLRGLLSAAVKDVAEEQSLDPSLVRAALFRLDGEVLRIVSGLTWNMRDEEELQIEIPPGEGSAGRAFEARRPNIAIYHSSSNDTSLSDAHQRSLVAHDLKWVISTPILGTNHEVVGVLNVDGLRIAKTWEELQKSVGVMIYWTQLAGLLLGASGEVQAEGLLI
jgi:hypothetical protein